MHEVRGGVILWEFDAGDGKKSMACHIDNENDYEQLTEGQSLLFKTPFSSLSKGKTELMHLFGIVPRHSDNQNLWHGIEQLLIAAYQAGKASQ